MNRSHIVSSHIVNWVGCEGCVQFAQDFATAILSAHRDQNLSSAVIRLDGTLGAGKTFFTQQFAKALGAADGEVTSPTFVIVQNYHTKPPIIHLDLYRVNDDDEFFELGIEEMFEQPSIMLIEWGAKFVSLLPVDHLGIEIDVISESDRIVTVTSYGPQSEAILRQLLG
jgi:tRNA threonylcarbamoyladenosine biosynthesis protein TsaE